MDIEEETLTTFDRDVVVEMEGCWRRTDLHPLVDFADSDDEDQTPTIRRNTSQDHLPLPIPHTHRWPGQSAFESELEAIQLEFQSLRCVESALGVSSCDICHTETGVMQEYKGDGMVWRGDFLHYVEVHNVKPSREFYQWVIARPMDEVSVAQRRAAKDERTQQRRLELHQQVERAIAEQRRVDALTPQQREEEEKAHYAAFREQYLKERFGEHWQNIDTMAPI